MGLILHSHFIGVQWEVEVLVHTATPMTTSLPRSSGR